MPVDFEVSRRLIEARSIERNDEPLGLEGHVGLDERISTQPRDKFRAHKQAVWIVPEPLRLELDDILGAVWQINEEHVGERSRVAEVSVCLDEAYIIVRDRLIHWTQRFLDQRLGKHSLKDGGDLHNTFHRIGIEYADILICLNIEGSLGYPFFDYVQTYALWRLYEQTYKATLELSLSPGRVVHLPKATPSWALKIAQDMNFLNDALRTMVAGIREAGERNELEVIDGLGHDALQLELAAAASDIGEMRPFLIHNFNPAKTLIGLGGGFTLAWDWTLRYGIANLIGGNSEREVLETLSSRNARMMTTVDYHGRLLDPSRPWSTSGVGYHAPSFGLSESVYVLRRFYEVLLGFYDRIDFDAIRKVGKVREAVEGLAEESVALVFAGSCRDLAERDSLPDPIDSVTARPHRRIAKLRLRTLLAQLEQSFGCEHRQGKGSEVVVSRNGSKFVLGRHLKNPEVSAVQVQRLLQRLGISRLAWVASVNG